MAYIIRATRSCSIEWHNQPSCMIVPSFSSFFGFLHSSSHDRFFTLFMCYDFWLWCYHLVQAFQERSELGRYDPYGLPGGHQVATLLHMKISQTTFEELTYLNCFASKTDHWQCCWHYWAAWTIHRSLNWTLLHSSYKLQEKIITICKIMFPFVQRHESSTPSLTWDLLSTWDLVISPTISKSSWHMLLLDVHKTIDSDLGYSLGHKWWSITPIWVILLHSK